MADEPELLKAIKTEYSEAKTHRAVWQDHWQQLRRWCRPTSPDFFTSQTNRLRGDRRHDEIYDSTAPWALDQFASGLSAVLTDPSSRWFGIGLQGVPMEELAREERLYLEDVADRIYFELSLPDSGAYATLHENYMDIGCFGTAVQFQFWDRKNSHMKFRSCPLADCFLAENNTGEIDKVFYRRKLNTRQMLQEFPQLINQPKEIFDPDKDREYELVHFVAPRRERVRGGILAVNKPWASYYFEPELPIILEESGFDYFPYNTARWTTVAGETYGRSPGMSVLADVRTLNQMQKELLVSAQLANFPPIVAEDDSILLPLAGNQGHQLTLTPKSVLWKEQGAEFPQAINSGMQPQLTLEMMQDLRQSVQRAFFVDHLIREKKKERQTTTEILDERGEMLRQLQPNFYRINSELHDNMIKTAHFLLERRGELPEPPQSLNGERMDVFYFSPAAKAQLGTKAQNISAFLQDITPLVSVDPTLLEEIDRSAMLAEYAKAREVFRIMKSPEVREREKAAAAQQQQQQALLEAAPQAAKAAKDVADARQKDPSLIPELSNIIQ